MFCLFKFKYYNPNKMLVAFHSFFGAFFRPRAIFVCFYGFFFAIWLSHCVAAAVQEGTKAQKYLLFVANHWLRVVSIRWITCAYSFMCRFDRCRFQFCIIFIFYRSESIDFICPKHLMENVTYCSLSRLSIFTCYLLVQLWWWICFRF